MKKRAPQRAERNERREALAAVAKKVDAFRPAREVLKRVRAVPTIFPQFDHAARVGGLPIERFMLVHGPSSHGKTAFVLGLMRSFLERDHFAVFIDAERTTPVDWAEKMMGPMVDHPGFLASRPTTYEDTILEVRGFLNTIIAAREVGKIPEDTAAIIVVDSLRKLVPQDLMKEILSDKGDTKAGRDRGGQLKAKMNAAWMDELVPLLEAAQAGFVAIAREMVDPDADMWAKKFGSDYKIGGGGAIFYEASLVMRVERASYVTHGEGKERKVYGERHRVTIRKTKVAGKDDKTSVGYFSTSNGVLIPEGFDTARDVLDLGVRLGVVKKNGATLSFKGERIGAGEHAAVKALAADPGRLATIDAAVREKFALVEPLSHDSDGVIET